MKRFKILLVNPQKDNVIDLPEAPPLGLLYLASVLRDDYEVWVLDFDALKYNIKEIENRILKEKPDMLGIGCTTLTYHNMVKISKLIKKCSPEIKVVIGGPYVTSYPKKCLNETGADFAVVGEGEIAIKKVIEFIKNGENGKIILGERIQDLDSIPFPAIDLLEPELTCYLGNLPRHRSPESVMLWSRGCPHNCLFCSDTVFGQQKPRFRGPENIVSEIKRLKDMGIKEIFVYDDELIGMHSQQTKWLEETCNLIIKSNLNDIIFKCQGRCSKYVNSKTLELMKKAGFRSIMWGCESGSDRVLKIIRKGTTTEQIKRTIRQCEEAGIEAWMFLMVGNYNETADDAELTVNLVKECKPNFVQVTYATPYPSDFEKICIEKNMIIQPDMSKWDTNEPVIKPDSMTIEEVIYYRQKIIDACNTQENQCIAGVRKLNKIQRLINDYTMGSYFNRTYFCYKDNGLWYTVKKIKEILNKDF